MFFFFVFNTTLKGFYVRFYLCVPIKVVYSCDVTTGSQSLSCRLMPNNGFINLLAFSPHVDGQSLGSSLVGTEIRRLQIF